MAGKAGQWREVVDLVTKLGAWTTGAADNGLRNKRSPAPPASMDEKTNTVLSVTPGRTTARWGGSGRAGGRRRYAMGARGTDTPSLWIRDSTAALWCERT
ncbi:hypothetical protein E2C01_046888 [Portunus trituberculatus]|uniref:Uncharacterized protein n=1 Tax=Portunus trituberculatus TaxID=210409 RepID=A0A5B7G682_PORTR|nr:hypothetical protein [Portunus trituberculatus]